MTLQTGAHVLRLETDPTGHSVSGVVTVLPQAARSIMFLAGG